MLKQPKEREVRAVKFRQWHCGKFHYWGYTDGGFIGPIHSTEHGTLNNSEQFTGLCDKNGREVFEGDIVLSWDGRGERGLDAARDVVRWNNKWVGWAPFCYLSFRDEYNLTWEIVGNAHENPELLGGR